MRLIDADEVIAKAKKEAIAMSEPFKSQFGLLVEWIAGKTSTAYDVDKVVEQLEDLKSRVPVNRVLDDIINDKPKELGMLIAYDKAIEIVKAGGIDGN